MKKVASLLALAALLGLLAACAETADPNKTSDEAARDAFKGGEMPPEARKTMEDNLKKGAEEAAAKARAEAIEKAKAGK